MHNKQVTCGFIFRGGTGGLGRRVHPPPWP
jgi:hypothetical protein